MKLALIALLPSLLIAPPLFASPEQMRENIDSEMPLKEAITDFNSTYPDPNPLTEDEVIASIRKLKSEYPEISDAMHDLYKSVIDERVLPKGMYFSKMTRLTDDQYSYRVEWMDLTWTCLPRSKPDPDLGWNFNHRVRARFVSSRELTSEEIENHERMKERMLKRVEQDGADQPATAPQLKSEDSSKSESASETRSQ